MTRQEFRDKYPSLYGTLAGDFYDSDPQEPDEVVATHAIAPGLFAPKLRAERLIGDSTRLLQNIKQEWEALSKAANRDLNDAAQARAWLLKVMAVWERALREMGDGRKPS